MKRQETNRTLQKAYVFPECLIRRLAEIPDHPLTLVEAPSGFGKTTAVREYLRDSLSAAAHERWYTCLGEPPSSAWDGICRLYGEGGEGEVARQLKELFPPTMENISDIVALVGEFRCDAETFLVIDNYQLFGNEVPNELIDAFSVHSNKKLHIIVITQPLPSRKESVHNANIHRLTGKDFFFDRGSTARMCRTLGVRLSEEELSHVQNTSGGWVSAIRLQAVNYRESGSLMHTGDMDDLIETAIWNRLSGEQRDFLMSLSLLDGFTVEQAAMMNAPGTEERPALPPNMAGLLKNNFFIPYVADKGVYSMHNLLRDYLLQRFAGTPSDFIQTMNRRAGAACEAASDYFGAARFYMKVRDFDAVLSMPFTNQYLDGLRETGIIGFLGQFVDECPEEVLQKYPLRLSPIAFYFMRHGRRSHFARLLEALRKRTDEPEGVSPRTMSLVRGELATLMSFTQYNDIAKMSAYHREALTCLSEAGGDARSAVFNTTTSGKYSWTFGITSVLYMFWREAGGLDKALSLMDECMPFYYQLTGGHGMGAENVMRAEAALLRGDDVLAEAAAYAAHYHASGAQQISICLCAELVLLRSAILRGDPTAYEKAVSRINRYADASRALPLRRLIELCLTTVALTLGTTEYIAENMPEWLRSAEGIRKALYVQSQPYGLMLYGRLLLIERRYAELYGLTGTVMDAARAMHCLLPQVCQMIYLAVAKQDEGVAAEASEYLNAALELAMPDRIYLPFAEFGETLLPMLAATDDCPDALKALCGRQIAGAASIAEYNANKKEDKTPLTSSERKIALLAKEGLNSAEIAARLSLTKNTVRSALKVIYNKLEVHSRLDLSKLEL